MTAHELPKGSFTVHIVERTPVEVAHSDFASISPDGGVLSVWDAEGWFHHIDAASTTRIAYEAAVRKSEG